MRNSVKFFGFKNAEQNDPIQLYSRNLNSDAYFFMCPEWNVCLLCIVYRMPRFFRIPPLKEVLKIKTVPLILEIFKNILFFSENFLII